MSHNEMKTNSDCNCYERVNHIKCDVKNCTYHAEGGVCHAEMIHVKPSFATSQNDTACGTFQAKG